MFCTRVMDLRYKLDDEEVLSAMDRVTAVPGDLSRPLLGLDDTAFKARNTIAALLWSRVRLVFHMYSRAESGGRLFVVSVRALSLPRGWHELRSPCTLLRLGATFVV